MDDPIYPGQLLEFDAFVRGPGSALAAASVAGATTLTVFDASRWVAPNVLKIGNGDPQASASEIVTIQSITGAAVTLTAGTLRAHAAGTPVYRILDATLAAQLEEPDATKTALTFNKVTDGRYRVSVTPDQAGAHDVEVVTSGAIAAAGAVTVYVVTDRVP